MFELKVSDLLNSLTHLLSEQIDSARIDVEVLMTHALQWRREKLYSHSDYVLSQTEQDDIAALVNRRLSGEPVAYITGNQEFWSLSLLVTPATLIPRPETEHLVEQALKFIPESTYVSIADLGTGSGAIALSIASERPQASVLGVDLSKEALDVATQNKTRLGLENVDFVKSNWFAGIEEQNFDVIVSNPPYIAEDDPHLKQGDLRFEPATALSSGNKGLKDIETIVKGAKYYLTNNGWLLLEHGYEQAMEVRALMERYNYKNISSAKDYAGHERITFAKK